MIRIHYVHTPDAESRLSRAIDMLLERMAWGTADHEDSLKGGKRPAEVIGLTKVRKVVKPKSGL